LVHPPLPVEPSRLSRLSLPVSASTSHRRPTPGRPGRRGWGRCPHRATSATFCTGRVTSPRTARAAAAAAAAPHCSARQLSSTEKPVAVHSLCGGPGQLLAGAGLQLGQAGKRPGQAQAALRRSGPFPCARGSAASRHRRGSRPSWRSRGRRRWVALRGRPRATRRS
jgi:hypothetical protein